MPSTCRASSQLDHSNRNYREKNPPPPDIPVCKKPCLFGVKQHALGYITIKLYKVPGFRKIMFDKLLTAIYSSGHKKQTNKESNKSYMFR